MLGIASPCTELHHAAEIGRDSLKIDSDQVRGPLPSLKRLDSSTRCAAASAWLGEELSVHFDDATVEKEEDRRDYSNASDDQLLAAAKMGDQQAFVELCRRHSPLVKKRIFSIVRNQEDAEDALQDTLLRAYKHLSAFRHTCKFSTWLTTIGTNTALMILRKKRTRKEGQTELLNDDSGLWQTAGFADESLDPERLHSRQQVILWVRRGVRKLQPTLRTIIEQHYGTECSLKESAEALDLSVAAVKSRLTRGRKTLRRYLGRRGILGAGV